MIRNRSRSPRRLDEILHDVPQTAAEERLMDEHIARESARISESWSAEERVLRSLGRCGDRGGMVLADVAKLDGWAAPVVKVRDLLGENATDA